MTPEEIQKHLDHRLKDSDAIVANATKFKVCDQCLSIVPSDKRVCCFCGAYRWHLNPDAVLFIARILGNTPFPVTSGIVPRL